jgi:hypothetical protein
MLVARNVKDYGEPALSFSTRGICRKPGHYRDVAVAQQTHAGPESAVEFAAKAVERFTVRLTRENT